MKITKTRLKQIIREELASLNEFAQAPPNLKNDLLMDPIRPVGARPAGLPYEFDDDEYDEVEFAEDDVMSSGEWKNMDIGARHGIPTDAWDDYFEEEPDYVVDPLIDRYTPGADEDIFMSDPEDQY